MERAPHLSYFRAGFTGEWGGGRIEYVVIL